MQYPRIIASCGNAGATVDHVGSPKPGVSKKEPGCDTRWQFCGLCKELRSAAATEEPKSADEESGPAPEINR